MSLPRSKDSLCLDLASAIIQVRSKIKAKADRNVEAAVELGKFHYSFLTDGRKDLFIAGQNPIIYMGISVGQKYHEGEHPKAQIECLENARKEYEALLESRLGKYPAYIRKSMPMSDWTLRLIVADSLQAFNDLKRRDIDFTIENQCVSMLHDGQLDVCAQPYIKLGSDVARNYRHCFTDMKNRTAGDSLVNFTMEPDFLWHEMKACYHDPNFIKLMNFFERSFKDGVQLLEKINSPILDNLKHVSLNDLCYLLSENVMMIYKLLNSEGIECRAKKSFLMYPGPISMVFEAGANLVASQFKGSISIGYLQCKLTKGLRKIGNVKPDPVNTAIMKITSALVEKVSMATNPSYLAFYRDKINSTIPCDDFKLQTFSEYCSKKPFIDAVLKTMHTLKQSQCLAIFGHYITITPARLNGVSTYTSLLNRISSPLKDDDAVNSAAVIHQFLSEKSAKLTAIDLFFIQELCQIPGNEIDYQALVIRAKKQSKSQSVALFEVFSHDFMEKHCQSTIPESDLVYRI